jgi:hypothetical protein
MSNVFKGMLYGWGACLGIYAVVEAASIILDLISRS